MKFGLLQSGNKESWSIPPRALRQNKRLSERILNELLTDPYQCHEATTVDPVRFDTALNPAGNSSGGNGGSCGADGTGGDAGGHQRRRK